MTEFLGMTFPVAFEWFIISQIFGLITIIFDFAALQIKNQRKYLLVTSIGSFFWMMMFITGGAQVPIILAAVFSALRGMVFWWIFKKDTPKRKIAGKTFLYVALAIGLVGAIIGIVNAEPSTIYLQVIMLVTALLFVVGQYLPSKHYLRAFGFLYAVSVLLINTPLDSFNPMGIAIEAAKIISIIIFYILLIRKNLLSKQLIKLKEVINFRLSTVNCCESQQELNYSVEKLELERLMVKMIRLELATLNSEKMISFAGVEEETAKMIADIQSIIEVKNLITNDEEELVRSQLVEEIA